jgi:hypothetical protein
MKILIACEESQVVCKAFRAKGHEAYSCDIIDCSGGHPEWHIKGDVQEVLDGDWVLNQPWDLIIAHPPCTYLCNSGVQHLWMKNAYGKTRRARLRWRKMESGARFFKALLDSDCDKIAVENPIPHKYAVGIIGCKYDQIIQPYMFGHMERKATCLWLKGLPHLAETNNVKEEMLKLPKREQQRLHYLPPSKDRAKLRSKTYQGIADAMADQWG